MLKAPPLIKGKLYIFAASLKKSTKAVSQSSKTLMKKLITINLIWSIVLLSAQIGMAQSASSRGSSYLLYGLVGLAIIILLALVVQVSDNLLAIEAKQSGADRNGQNFSIFPRWKEILAPKLPAYVNGPATILRRGFNILLQGEADKKLKTAYVSRYAVQPPNFVGISPIPKLLVEVGQEVKAGDLLFFDKKRPEIKYAAPVSGEVVAINRGAKRSIAEIVILADKEQSSRTHTIFDLVKGSREELVDYLLETGAWPMFRQRPYEIIPDPQETPRNIFISTFDSAPLAPDLDFVINGKGEAFQKGLDVLNKLTDGKVYLGLNASRKEAPSPVFTEAKGVELHWFHGKHPAGNAGVQIHHIAPVNASEKAWVVGVQEVVSLGILFTEGRFDASRIVVLSGAELKEPHYVQTYQGANIGELIRGQVADESKKVRFISGDPLSGQKKDKDGFLNFFDDQVTVIEEGDDYEMFGWLIPSYGRPSVSRTYPNFLFPNIKYKANTNTHGEKRAFVVTGQYESVLPMDIYPQHLMKAILVNDFERMEGLGIYELSEEDLALCEFTCTSKQPLQKILRQGLDMMREQG